MLGLHIKCSSIKTVFFLVYTCCMFLPFQRVSQLLDFMNVCSKLEVVTELIELNFLWALF